MNKKLVACAVLATMVMPIAYQPPAEAMTKQQYYELQRAKEIRDLQEIKNRQNQKNQIHQYYNYGIQAYNNKDFSSAINYLGRVSGYYGNTKNFNIAVGNSFYGLQNFGKSIPYLQKALGYGASDLNTVSNIGYAYMNLGNFTTAYKYLVAATNRYPNNADLQFNLAKDCEQLKNDACQLNAYLKVIAINPQYSVDPYKYAGNIYFNAKNYDKGFNLYTQGLQYYPRDAELNFYAGDTLFTTENYEKALPYLKMAVNIQGDYLHAYYDMGVSYLKLDDLDDAGQVCSIMQKINSEDDLTKSECSQVQQVVLQKQMEQQMQQDMIQQQIDQSMQDAQMAASMSGM